jgi:hypothetical protein
MGIFHNSLEFRRDGPDQDVAQPDAKEGNALVPHKKPSLPFHPHHGLSKFLMPGRGTAETTAVRGINDLNSPPIKRIRQQVGVFLNIRHLVRNFGRSSHRLDSTPFE